MKTENNFSRKYLNFTNMLWIYFVVTVTINIPHLIIIKSPDFLLFSGDIGTDILLFYSEPFVTQILNVWGWGALGVAFVTIVLGIKKLQTDSRNYKALSMLIIGSVICVMFFISHLFLKNQNEQLKTVFEPDVIPGLEKSLKEKELTGSKRAAFEKFLAKEIYVREGRLISILDEEGNPSVFNPSERDEASKRNHDYIIKLIPENERTAKKGMILWASVLLLSIFIGILLNIKNKTESNNNVQMNADQQ